MDHGRDFAQWTGSAAQRQTLAEVAETSALVRSMISQRTGAPDGAEVLDGQEALDGPGVFESALWRVLRAETSRNFYWGDAWLDRVPADLGEARRALFQTGLVSAETRAADLRESRKSTARNVENLAGVV